MSRTAVSSFRNESLRCDCLRQRLPPILNQRYGFIFQPYRECERTFTICCVFFGDEPSVRNPVRSVGSYVVSTRS